MSPVLSDPRVRRLHRRAPLCDLHAHPGFKPYLLGRRWEDAGRTPARFNPFSYRTSWPALEADGLGLVMMAHTVPEAELFRDSPPLAWLARRACPTWPWLAEGRPFDRIEEMVRLAEGEVRRRAGWRLARSSGAVEAALAAGERVLVHAVEGAHVLEGDLGRLETLAAWGVRMLTVGHLYPNAATGVVDAIPDYPLLGPLANFRTTPEDAPEGLTRFGRDVVEACVRLGILVDLVHATPRARHEMLEVVGGRAPVVASHVGVRALHDVPYNLSDDELRAIARGGGVVGVILMDHWLVGAGASRGGVEAVWRTMRHIREVTGSWRHVGIGTDFDGFTEPPEGLTSPADLGQITARLLEEGLAEEDVLRVLGGNLRRALRAASGSAGTAGRRVS